jgi:multidrug resistance efflux pump
VGIEIRKIVAPLDGEVVDLRKHEGEWVQPGDTLLKIIRLDRLRIEGFLNASTHGHSELRGRSVDVWVVLAHGRRERFDGRVVLVNPQVEASGEFRVRVEVLNRKENDAWLLHPGRAADMSIDLK